MTSATAPTAAWDFLHVDGDASLPVHLRRRGYSSAAPLPVEEVPDRIHRVVLVGVPGAGTGLALRRMLERPPEAPPRQLVVLDGEKSLREAAAPALPKGTLLVDGLDRLDDEQRSAALKELMELSLQNSELGYVVALLPEHCTRDVSGELVGMRPLTPTQISERLRLSVPEDLYQKAGRESRDLILDLGRRPLYLDFLIEVLLGYGNLPATREQLLRALVDHRIDQQVNRQGEEGETTWQIREPLGQLAWQLVTSPAGSHRIDASAARTAFQAALSQRGVQGDGSRELDMVLACDLMQKAPGDSLQFSTSELESWFAACEVARQVQLQGAASFLDSRLPRVAEAVSLAAAQLSDPSPLAHRCLQQGQDLLVAHALRASRDATGWGTTVAGDRQQLERRQFEQAFFSRISNGLNRKSRADVRERSLACLSILDTNQAQRKLLELIRDAIRPPRRRPGGGEQEPLSHRLETRLAEFAQGLAAIPPSGQRRILQQLAETGRLHETLASATLFRLLNLDLDADSIAAFDQVLAGAGKEGDAPKGSANRNLHMLLYALGASVVGRSLAQVLESRELTHNPFPLGRLLREYHTPTVEASLQDALESPDERVRQVAIFVLADSGEPLAMGEIEAYAGSSLGQRRWFAAAALEGVTSGNALQLLERLAKDNSPRVRSQAENSLKSSRKRDAWERLAPRLAEAQSATGAELLSLLAEARKLGGAAALERALDHLPREAITNLVAALQETIEREAAARAKTRDVPSSAGAASAGEAAGEGEGSGEGEASGEDDSGAAQAEQPAGDEKAAEDGLAQDGQTQDGAKEDEAKGAAPSGKRRSRRRGRKKGAGQQLLESLPRSILLRVLDTADRARIGLAVAGNRPTPLRDVSFERLLVSTVEGAGFELPLASNHEGITAAVDALQSLAEEVTPPGRARAEPGKGAAEKDSTEKNLRRRGSRRRKGKPVGSGDNGSEVGQEQKLPLQELLGETLGIKLGTLCEVLRRRLLSEALEPAQEAWHWDLLAEMGGAQEPLRVIADPAFATGISEELRGRLSRAIPSVPLPDPMLSVAARRALEWFRLGGGRGRGEVRFPESHDEIRIDPFAYLAFRRFADEHKKSALGAALASVLGADQDPKRLERNLGLVRRLDGGLLPRVQAAAGLEAPTRKKPSKRAKAAEDAPAAIPAATTAVDSEAANAGVPNSGTPDSGDGTAAAEQVAAEPNRETAAAADVSSPRATEATAPDGAQARGEPTAASSSGSSAADASEDETTLLEFLEAQWEARTASQGFGRGKRRRSRSANQRLRDLIVQLAEDAEATVAGTPGLEQPGALAGVLALAPGDEDQKVLLGSATLRERIAADLGARDDAPWAREAERRLAEGSS